MKKMTRLASGKTGSGREDRPYMAQLRPGEVIGSYQKKGVEEGARDLRIKVPAGKNALICSTPQESAEKSSN